MIAKLEKTQSNTLTLFTLMDSSILFDKIKLGWFIMQIRGSEVKIFKLRCILTLKIVFILAKRVDHSEMPHFVGFYLSLHCLKKYPFACFLFTRG